MSGDLAKAAHERFEERSRNPAFKKDPVWGGMAIPKEQPWRPLAEREPVEKIGRRARRRLRPSRGGPSEP